MAAACETARERFSDLTGSRAVDVRLYFRDSIAMRGDIKHSTLLMRLPTPATMAAAASRLGNPAPPFGGGWEGSLSNIARHEVGHLLLAAALHDSGGFVGSRYGTSMPDWFDEAIAEWDETDESRAERLAEARSDEPQVDSLREFVNSTHPLIGSESLLEQNSTAKFGPCRGDCGATYRVGTQTIRRRLLHDGTIRTDTTWTEPGVAPPTRAVEIFYPISLSIITFVHQRFGPEGTKQVASRLAHGASSVDVLGDLMPEGGFDAFELEWRAWLRGSRSTQPSHPH